VSSRLELQGLVELRAALRSLPDDLVRDADAIVTAQAQEAAREVQSGYPQRTGNLKRGVSVQTESSRGGVVARVRSRSQHAHLFEKGTGVRRTASGANRGSMPAAPPNQAAIPVFIRARRRMYMALIAMVEKTGLVVTSS
jgi:hypothetical protein